MEVLKLNSVGPNVELLQNTLKKLGFYNYEIDGIFGNNTKNSVINFQKSFYLEPDGIVGKETWNALSPYLYGFINYIVQAGDSIYTIANKYNTSVNAIITANPNISSSNLLIGSSIIVPIGSIVPTNISYTSNILKMNIYSLEKIYPFLQFGNIGKTVLGRDIPFIKFGNGNKEVFYNASIHANEWITTPLLMKFIEVLSKGYVNNANVFGYNARQLFNQTSLYIVPMINLDGVDLVTGLLNNTEIYKNAQKISSNYPDIPFPSSWKANISGVDLNLQFPAGWEQAKEIKYNLGFTSPAPRDFVGYGPLTAPESLALYNFTLSHNFNKVISYHTQGEVIYWQYQNYAPPSSYYIGNQFSLVSGYSLEDTPYNSSFAGYKDWFIYAYRKPGFTIEAGFGQNPLPISQFDKIYKDNLGILVLGMVL
ncbi:MAG: M14 family zinc carboxypeptidase [Candidatus Scatovivens sp.]